MRIKTRLQVNAILCAVLTVMIASFVLMAVHKMKDKIEKARIAANIVKDVAELKIVMHEYLLYPAERPLMQWKSKYGSLTKYLTRVANKYENPYEKIALSKILQNLTRLETAFVDLTTRFGKEQGLGKDRNTITSKLQKRLIGELLVKSQAMVSAVFQLERAIQTDLVAAQQRDGLIVGIFLLILTVLITAISLWIYKSIGTPIAKLQKGVQIIGSGNLDHKLGTAAKDEIGELSRALDKMTDNLKETTASIVVLNREIDGRKRAEERLMHLASIVQFSHDAICSTTLDGIIKSWNTGAEKIFGYTEEEIVGKSASMLFPPDKIYEVPEILEKIKTGQVVDHFETVQQKKDGTTIEVSLTISPIRDIEGRIVGVSCISRDISEKMRLEAQLLQSQKMEAIGTLAGGVAHDFNNLLTTIIGNAELALMELSRDTHLKGNIEEIRKAGQRATSLTRQLLAFSRKQVIQPKVLNLNGLIRDTEKMLRRLIGEDIDLVTVFRHDLWPVKVDPGQMEQVIMNMAVNARDAMPRGGKLIIETANVELDKAYLRDHGVQNTAGPYVMLAVSDNGMGMDKEIQPHIFEPFFTTKERGRGTGLGLSTVYGIVKQNRGFIWAYSEPGKGTTFKIYFPIFTAEDEYSVQKAQTRKKPRHGSETVLLVEDDEMVQEIIRDVLKQYGYHVLEAKDGEEAIKTGKEYKGTIHLLLTDVVLPGLSGRELAELLQSERQDIRVLYMSGYTDNVIVHHGVLDDDTNFIEKPFTLEGLARKVREVLDQGIDD